MTVDGTDFPINEPIPFSAKSYLHKFCSAGLQYKVGVCIQSGDIVWTHGPPFLCGKYLDITKFRKKLINYLADGEMVESRPWILR